LRNTQTIQVGFAHQNLLTAKLDLGRQNYSEEQGRVFYQQMLDRFDNLPGVQSASLAATVPLQGSSFGNSIVLENQGELNIRYNVITPNYLDTAGVSLLLGRRFTETDNAESPRVALINETLARYAWPNENPVGKYFQWKDGKKTRPIQVIGVTRDVKGTELLEDTPRGIYLPLAQQYNDGMTLHLRTNGKPEQLIAATQREISALDKKLPVYNVKSLEQYRQEALSETRIQALLLSVFGLLALLLASIGLYGVLSYSVAQRTQEIGIRMALGAQGGNVLRMVVGQGMKLVGLGCALGLAGALAATRVLKSVLYGVSATDPWTFAAVALMLASVALLACYLPARRATKVDPMVALRCE
jgi:predicted permease